MLIRSQADGEGMASFNLWLRNGMEIQNRNEELIL
jgi:hypothetical protein